MERSLTYRPASLAALLIVPVAAGWLIGAAWMQWTMDRDAWYEAGVQWYLTMTGQAGPTTYLVTHTDFHALQASVATMSDVLGIEVYEYPGVAAIAFHDSGAQAIETISAMASVQSMRQAYVPMICH